MSHPHEPKKRPRASISSSLDNQSYNSHSASLSTPRPVPWPTPSHYVRTSLPLFSTSSPDALLSQSLRAVAIYHRRSAGGGSSSGGRVGSATPPLRGGLSGVPVRLSCAASLSHLLSLTPSPEVHSALALAIVRSVNLFTDAARRRSCLGGGGPAASEPVSALAERIGLPNYVVMVRHGCAHERTLPGYKVLKISAETILRWIREEEERKQLPQQHQKRDGRLDSAHRQPPSRHFHHLPQDYNDLLHFIEQQSKSLALVAEKEAKELVVEAVRKFPGLHVRFIVEATEALLDTLLLVPADANSNAGENFDADNKFVDEIIFSATKKKPILHGDAKATVNTDANANISVDTNSNANARASANANADANSNEDKVHEKGMPPAEKKNDTTAIKQTANVASRWIKYFLSTHFYTALLLPPSLEKKRTDCDKKYGYDCDIRYCPAPRWLLFNKILQHFSGEKEGLIKNSHQMGKVKVSSWPPLAHLPLQALLNRIISSLALQKQKGWSEEGQAKGDGTERIILDLLDYLLHAVDGAGDEEDGPWVPGWYDRTVQIKDRLFLSSDSCSVSMLHAGCDVTVLEKMGTTIVNAHVDHSGNNVRSKHVLSNAEDKPTSLSLEQIENMLSNNDNSDDNSDDDDTDNDDCENGDGWNNNTNNDANDNGNVSSLKTNDQLMQNEYYSNENCANAIISLKEIEDMLSSSSVNDHSIDDATPTMGTIVCIEEESLSKGKQHHKTVQNNAAVPFVVKIDENQFENNSSPQKMIMADCNVSSSCKLLCIERKKGSLSVRANMSTPETLMKMSDEGEPLENEELYLKAKGVLHHHMKENATSSSAGVVPPCWSLCHEWEPCAIGMMPGYSLKESPII